MSKLYYTAPNQEVFEEVKSKAIEVWKTYDDTYNYATEKVARIKDITNVGDNMMFMVAMFDIDNQRKLAYKLSPETRQAVRERMIDGGQPSEYNPF